MTASWEIAAQNQVLVGILHTETVPIAWAFGLRNLIIPGPPPLPVAGMPFCMARNVVCQRALEMGVPWLFFLDSDVVPPRDAILRLMAHRRPIMSGVYHRRSPPAGAPVMIKNGTWLYAPPDSGVVEVDYVGAGCLLIHRSVLEALPPLDERRGKHWFDWRVDMPGLPPGETLSEDFAFCLQAKRALGVPILVDTSVQCKHVGLAQATFGRLDPAEVHAVT